MQIFSLRRGNSFAVDLGNNNTILSKVDRSLTHPSLVVLNKNDHSIKAVGKEAFEMLGKVQDSYRVVKPLKEGLIADYNSTREMLKTLVSSAYPKNSLLSGFSHIIAGIPYASTEVERRALRDSLDQFNASKIFLIFEPIAAAIGMGLDISEPDGRFVVDIGGGITESVALSLSGIVSHQAIKTAGDTLDADIQQFVKAEYNVDIGVNMAEQVKIHVGAAVENIENPPDPLPVIGKDSVTGIPREIHLSHTDIAAAVSNSVTKIEQSILQTLEACPPELSGDIYDNGIHLTGGASLLRGFRERLAAKVRIPVHQDPEALCSVAKGMIAILKDPDRYRTVLFR